jgi:hypothetical protein
MGIKLNVASCDLTFRFKILIFWLCLAITITRKFNLKTIYDHFFQGNLFIYLTIRILALIEKSDPYRWPMIGYQY